MTSRYKRPHHKLIDAALKNFNVQYLRENKIYFGGGTRIALELNEYRESVDIDFFCPDSLSYKSVRRQVSNRTLGELVNEDFDYLGDIRPDRDAVRAMVIFKGVKIKLEFVAFSDYSLQAGEDIFPVPSIDRVSCFYTKLLANADRYRDYPYKDIIDICAMVGEWGSVPQAAIDLAVAKYGEGQIIPSLVKALNAMLASPNEYSRAADDMLISQDKKILLLEKMPKQILAEYS
ncbi:MAG: nucleotidyl transferase AbiEii/AbiGii toxin family protein [Cellvibrionaceae bacterium]|nr:nucleotidyl transferase AbiEii/AbiGii toxin family protein [Cellvibrionaceae bacterium]